VLNYLLIFGSAGFPEMGIRGAAIATVISSAFATGLYVVLMLRKPMAGKYATRRIRLEWSLFVRLLRFGVPSGVQFIVDIGGFTVFLMLVGRIGIAELAATNIAFNINSLAFMPMLGLGVAVRVLVGQYIGHDRPDAAARSTWSGFRLSMLYMGSIAVLYVTIPGVFAGLFAPRADPASFEGVRSITVTLLRFVALYSLIDTLNIVFASAIKGAGDTRFAMVYLLIMSGGVLIVPCIVLIGVMGLSVYVAWWILTGYIIVLGVGFMARFLGGKWKSMRVIEEGHQK